MRKGLEPVFAVVSPGARVAYAAERSIIESGTRASNSGSSVKSFNQAWNQVKRFLGNEGLLRNESQHELIYWPRPITRKVKRLAQEYSAQCLDYRGRLLHR